MKSDRRSFYSQISVWAFVFLALAVVASLAVAFLRLRLLFWLGQSETVLKDNFSAVGLLGLALLLCLIAGSLCALLGSIVFFVWGRRLKPMLAGNKTQVRLPWILSRFGVILCAVLFVVMAASMLLHPSADREDSTISGDAAVEIVCYRQNLESGTVLERQHLTTRHAVVRGAGFVTPDRIGDMVGRILLRSVRAGTPAVFPDLKRADREEG